MTASIACIFQSLSHSSKIALERVTSIIEKVGALNSRSIENACYERAKTFFEQISNSKSLGDQPDSVNGGGGVRKKDVSQEITAFSSRLIDMLIGPNAGRDDPEAVRMKRVGLALAYLGSAVACDAGKLTLTKSLELWLETERSGLVREPLKRALQQARA